MQAFRLMCIRLLLLVSTLMILGCRSPYFEGRRDARVDIADGQLQIKLRHTAQSTTQRIQSQLWLERFGVTTSIVGCPHGEDANRMAGYNAEVWKEMDRRFGTNWFVNTYLDAEAERKRKDYAPNQYE